MKNYQSPDLELYRKQILDLRHHARSRFCDIVYYPQGPRIEIKTWDKHSNPVVLSMDYGDMEYQKRLADADFKQRKNRYAEEDSTKIA